MIRVKHFLLIALAIVLLPMSVASCGGDDEDTLPPEEQQGTDKGLKIEWEDAQYVTSNGVSVLGTVLHITNLTGQNLTDVVVGRGENGSDGHRCVADNGNDLTPYMTIAIDGEQSSNTHEVTLDIPKNTEKVLAVLFIGYRMTDEKSINVSLSIDCANYQIKEKYLVSGALPIIVMQ